MNRVEFKKCAHEPLQPIQPELLRPVAQSVAVSLHKRLHLGQPPTAVVTTLPAKKPQLRNRRPKFKINRPRLPLAVMVARKLIRTRTSSCQVGALQVQVRSSL